MRKSRRISGPETGLRMGSDTEGIEEGVVGGVGGVGGKGGGG